MLIRLLTAILIAATVTAPAHAATPVEASASFAQDLLHVPTYVVEGEVDFEDTTDDQTKITGHFTQGYTQPNVEDYKWVLVNDAGKVVVDLTPDIRAIAEIAPPEVGEFQFTYKTKVKDLLGLDFVVCQIVELAGLKPCFELGRAKIYKDR
ncbi:hypothetical protein Lesp02_16770 [Lentzea sp. NBRC 105346]|uniref:hypothetical protein n=1 Tax=Lentzea sp. NBRC 105346 TaxID=3032205 RepID=UPI0024A127F4|nr:hypothetical protein [Lentzea sp. NBRC 105346]GLZ29487.1 hypothetical protein Lesp02_16770 [Lentzea sp. NBRC 105346]